MNTKTTCRTRFHLRLTVKHACMGAAPRGVFIQRHVVPEQTPSRNVHSSLRHVSNDDSILCNFGALPSPWALGDKGTKELSCRASLIASIRLSDRSRRVWNFKTFREDSMPLRYALDFGVAGACIWSDTVPYQGTYMSHLSET